MKNIMDNNMLNKIILVILEHYNNIFKKIKVAKFF